MNKRKLLAKAACDASKTANKKSNQEIKVFKINSNARPKPISKPNSANPITRCLKIGENSVTKKKYSPNKAALIIQRHVRLFLTKVNECNKEVNEIIKRKKMGILQSYNITLDGNSMKETAKFGVFDSNDNNTLSTSNNHSKDDNNKKIEGKECASSRKETNGCSKMINKGIGIPDNKSFDNIITTEIPKGVSYSKPEKAMNGDLKGLKRKFYYNDDEEEPNEDFDDYLNAKRVKSVNQVSKEAVNNNNNTGEEKKKKESHQEKETAQLINSSSNKEKQKKENVYEKLYKEMQKKKAQDSNVEKSNRRMNASQPEIAIKSINTSKEEIRETSNVQHSTFASSDNNVNKNPIKKGADDDDDLIKQNIMSIPCLIKFKKKKRETKQNELPEREIGDCSSLEESKKLPFQTDLVEKIKQLNEINIPSSMPLRDNPSSIIEDKLNAIDLMTLSNNNKLDAVELGESKKAEKLNKTANGLKYQHREDTRNTTQLNEATKNQYDELPDNLKEKDLLIIELKTKLSQMEKNSCKMLQSLKVTYDDETKKSKEAWFQAGKIQRKQWEEKKLKEIKELTAKGLVPEIEIIVSQHKREVAAIGDKYKKENIEQKQILIEEFETKIVSIKAQLTKEKEEAIEYEREVHSQRLRNQNKRLEEEMNEERMRWNAKMEMELSRLNSLRDKEKQLYEDQIKKLEDTNNKATVYFNGEHLKMMIDEISLMKASNHEKEHNNLYGTQGSLESKTEEIIKKLKEEAIAERTDEITRDLKENNALLSKQVNELTNALQAEITNRVNCEESIKHLNHQLSTKEQSLIELNEQNKALLAKSRDPQSSLKAKDGEIELLNNKLLILYKLSGNQKSEIDNAHRREVEAIEAKLKSILKNRDEIIKQLQADNQLKDLALKKYEEIIQKQIKDHSSK